MPNLTTSMFIHHPVAGAFFAFLLVVALPWPRSYAFTVEPGTNCLTGIRAPVAESSVFLSRLSPGPYAADSLSPHFSNPRGYVSSNSYWTPAPQDYFSAADYTRFSLQSRYCSRDMEVDTWARNGIVFLRTTADGRAIYFFHNGDATPDGHIEIGLVTSLVEGAGYRYAGGNFYPIYSASLTNVPGYNLSHAQGAYFTFGVQGFTIYARFNSLEFIRFREYRHMAEGRAVLQANYSYGFKDVTVRTLRPQPLYSDYANSILDLRDFGLNDLHATGSIDKGSKTLTLKRRANLQAGDYVIVETGGEAGAGARGTRGVGGTWPTRSYPTLSTMSTDASGPDGLYAWVEETGDVYRWLSGAWRHQSHDYYIAKAIPLALHARVTAVRGTSVTLDRPAAVTTHKANIYFDNSYIFNKLARDPRYDGEANFPEPRWAGDDADFRAITPTNLTVRLPAGNFALGYMLLLINHEGWTLEGAGRDRTRLFSPKGVPSAMLTIHASPGTTVRHLHLEGNARDSGYGLQWSLNRRAVGETWVEQGAFAPSGVLFQNSPDGRAAFLRVTDVFQKAVGTAFSDNVWANQIENIMTDGLRVYVQWQFQWTDSVGGGCVDCTITSPTLIAGFEAFKSKDTQFVRPVGTNASIAMNSAGNFLIQDARLTVEAMSQHPDRAFSEYNPLININSNIDAAHPYLVLGGTINNATIIHEGYINANKDLLRGIVVNVNNPSISISGGLYQAPDYQMPSRLNGPNGVTSSGTNTVVDGMKVVGTVSTNLYPGANILVEDGIVVNCIADTIRVAVPTVVTNCQTNAGSPSVIEYY
jgi:hypothetical protein